MATTEKDLNQQEDRPGDFDRATLLLKEVDQWITTACNELDIFHPTRNGSLKNAKESLDAGRIELAKLNLEAD